MARSISSNVRIGATADSTPTRRPLVIATDDRLVLWTAMYIELARLDQRIERIAGSTTAWGELDRPFDRAEPRSRAGEPIVRGATVEPAGTLISREGR